MSSARSSATTHVALLRGINVGGKHKLPMKTLSGFFTKAGASDVRTYIQSGNVVFTSSSARVRELCAQVADAIETSLGFRAPIVARPASALSAIRDACPFLAQGEDPSTLHVAFLADEPSQAAIATLDPARSPGDRFAVRGAEIYLHLPNGVARTKLTNAYFDSKLQTTSTVRNWRTLGALIALAEG